MFYRNDPQPMVGTKIERRKLGLKILFSSFYYVDYGQVFNYCDKTTVFVFLCSSSVRFTLEENKLANEAAN